MVNRQRLFAEDVEHGTADLLLLQRVDHSGFVDKTGTRSIYKNGRGLHLREFCRAEHILRLRAQTDVQGNEVGLLQQLVK